MAGIEGAVLGAAVSIGLGAYTATSGFSARHDHTHDAQVAETRELVDDFERLRKSGDMADEDYDVYLDRKDIAIQSSKEYRDSISDFKSTGLLNPIKKLEKRKEVRKRKRQAREANQSLHDHYYDSSACRSDASSIAAQSGSPPRDQEIRGWADRAEKETRLDGPPEDATEQEKIQWRRRQNTIAARKSRKRKMEQMQQLQDDVERLSKDRDLWKERALMMTRLLISHGLPCPNFEH